MSDQFPSSAYVLLICVPFLSISISSSGRTARIYNTNRLGGQVCGHTHRYESEICRLKLRENLHFRWKGLNAVCQYYLCLRKAFSIGLCSCDIQSHRLDT